MKHRLISALLCAGLLLTLLPAASAFSDVPDSDTSEAVAVLSGMGIVSGYSDGNYHPNDILTRAQFCKLAILMENKGDQAAASGYRSLFTDLSSTHWAVGYVNLAYSDGLVSGYGNGMFGPDDPVTCGQAVTIIFHILGYENDDIGPFWPEDFMNKAAKLGLTDGIGTSANQNLTRGQAARMLLSALNLDTADGEEYLSTWASTTVDGALVMDNDDEADDGRANTAEIYADGSVSWYDQTNQIDSTLVGRRGTLLLDKTGKVEGFVPEENVWKAVSIDTVDASGITDTGGKTYDVPSSAAVVLDEEKETWSSAWYDLTDRGTARLYYSDSGSIDLVYVGTTSHTVAAVIKSKNAALKDLTSGLGISGNCSIYKNGAVATEDDLAQYDVGVYDSATESLRVSDVKLTGVYENASPNTEDPSTITIMGAELPVLDQAVSGLRSFSIGDQITVLLTADGQVAAAVSASKVSADAVGILDSLSDETAKVTLYNGLTVQGTVSNTNVTSKLVGGVVKVASYSTGKLSLSTISSSRVGKLDVTAGTVGSLKLAPKVWIYDRVSRMGTAVQVDLDDLTISTVAASGVGYVRTNEAGQADLLVLEDITGDCYTYGYLTTGSQSGGSGSMAYTNETASVENSTGTHGPYVTGIDVSTGEGGIAVSNDQVTASVTLTAAGDVSRSDFSEVDDQNMVVADGYTISISDDVQVYNETTDTWTTLSAAKAFSNAFTVYYDKTPTTGGKVRLIVVED